jgi:predicted kinase
MPRLSVLNGPPGSGKSTLAQRYVEDRPMSLSLDVDRLRGMLGRWADDPSQAGELARAIARAAAEVHLRAGHDVVVPQFLARPAFLEQLEHLAAQVGAAFHEIVVLAADDELMRRFDERTRQGREQIHLDAQHLLDAQGGSAALPALQADLMALVATRPGATLLETTTGDAAEAYRGLLALLDRRSGPSPGRAGRPGGEQRGRE